MGGTKTVRPFTVQGHGSIAYSALPLNVCLAQFLSTASSEKELVNWIRREFLPFKVLFLLLFSVHLPRSASSLFLAGEDGLFFPRVLTWTDKTHGHEELSTCSHVLVFNAGRAGSMESKLSGWYAALTHLW